MPVRRLEEHHGALLGGELGQRARGARPACGAGSPRSRTGRTGRPDTASAVVTALGPGAAVTGTPASTRPATSRKPGSETLGMPPSVTTATRAPSGSASTSSGVRRSSLPSK